jgi:hypothetical protein
MSFIIVTAVKTSDLTKNYIGFWAVTSVFQGNLLPPSSGWNSEAGGRQPIQNTWLHIPEVHSLYNHYHEDLKFHM